MKTEPKPKRVSKEVLKERERIKLIIMRWKLSIEHQLKHIRKRYRTLNRTQIQRILNKIIFRIDNPDYIRKTKVRYSI